MEDTSISNMDEKRFMHILLCRDGKWVQEYNSRARTYNKNNQLQTIKTLTSMEPKYKYHNDGTKTLVKSRMGEVSMKSIFTDPLPRKNDAISGGKDHSYYIKERAERRARGEYEKQHILPLPEGFTECRFVLGRSLFVNAPKVYDYGGSQPKYGWNDPEQPERLIVVLDLDGGELRNNKSV
jgi:hypothetical protein